MILITGATGLIGRALLELFDHDDSIENNRIILYVRKTSDITGLKEKGFNISYGDMSDKEALLEAIANVDTIIHIVQMRYSPTIVDVAIQNRMKRLIIVGTTGVFSKYQYYASDYKRAEEYIVKNCTVPYVVLRPTMIYGANTDKNMNELLKFIRKFHFFPMFGSGSAKMQPIYYKDLAQALFDIYKNPELKNKFYNLAGKNALTYYELLKIASEELNRKVWIIKIPFWLATSFVRIYNKLSRNPKVRLEQVRRLNEDKAFNYSNAYTDFGFNPLEFKDGIKRQIESMFGR
jgi:uncharacterized protein YbjT (DUF2867 family)